ncbi:hypothetical protein ACFVQ4_15550 [Streptomyces laurentii]|uniref:hypothetical protein n=1 Tax=Streptomyces laurentii TaxID=39478 RepID=UPI00369235A4
MPYGNEGQQDRDLARDKQCLRPGEQQVPQRQYGVHSWRLSQGGVPLGQPQDRDESVQVQYNRRPCVLVGVGHVHDVGHHRLTQMGGEGARGIGLARCNIQYAGDLSIGRRRSPRAAHLRWP